MQQPAWILIGAGGLLIILGLLWLVSPSIPWMGRLPGDLAIERERFRFYAPLTTCLILSGLLSAAMWIAQRLLR